jgi:hypothetical protein
MKTGIPLLVRAASLLQVQGLSHLLGLQVTHVRRLVFRRPLVPVQRRRLRLRRLGRH